jgi:hypothetical protein
MRLTMLSAKLEVKLNFHHVREKAAEGCRSPRREAFAYDLRIAQSVLECASPLPLLHHTILHVTTLIGETGETIYSWRTNDRDIKRFAQGDLALVLSDPALRDACCQLAFRVKTA